MSFWDKKLQKLQKQPYEVRLRILRWLVGGAAVVLILIWILGLRFRRQEASSGFSNLEPIWQNLQKFKDLNLK